MIEMEEKERTRKACGWKRLLRMNEMRTQSPARPRSAHVLCVFGNLCMYIFVYIPILLLFIIPSRPEIGHGRDVSFHVIVIIALIVVESSGGLMLEVGPRYRNNSIAILGCV